MDSAGRAFERLFADEYRRVVSIAFRITRDQAEAEDIAQDVFVRFARIRRAPDRVQSWLYTAALHSALNAVRASRRRSARERRNFQLQLAAERHLENANDPQRLVEQGQDAQLLRTALLRIARRDAEILVLRYSGLSYREVAAVLGVDAAQVGTRLARAERALKHELERELERETFR
jgi:RNA polymerase sigma-70 factor (ECF subfamily)